MFWRHELPMPPTVDRLIFVPISSTRNWYGYFKIFPTLLVYNNLTKTQMDKIIELFRWDFTISTIEGHVGRLHRSFNGTYLFAVEGCIVQNYTTTSTVLHILEFRTKGVGKIIRTARILSSESEVTCSNTELFPLWTVNFISTFTDRLIALHVDELSCQPILSMQKISLCPSFFRQTSSNLTFFIHH